MALKLEGDNIIITMPDGRVVTNKTFDPLNIPRIPIKDLVEKDSEEWESYINSVE